MPMLQAEACQRGQHHRTDHRRSEERTPAHLPSAKFTANAAWLTCAAIAHNLTRAAGCLASTFHAKARPATVRDHLINIPARIATSARRITLHLPTTWRWRQPWQALTAAIP